MAAVEYDWQLNFGSIALMWRGGCIIRAQFPGRIKEAFDADPQLANLLLAPYFQQAIAQSQSSWRRVIAKAVEHGYPCLHSAARWPILTATAPTAYQQTYCRPSATTLVPIPTSAQTGLGVLPHQLDRARRRYGLYGL